ncbi:MAG: bifunctional class I SAM-dependent methyltransferase/glycosyltransferase family 2 protein [Bacteroidia bacterium]|nr:bifunctional class I SAM-dependent methyltransferase/glycosyltransferase family 2 protein [Bacteroidia bacterium]
MKENIKTYFDELASKKKPRAINAYYWNEITRYIEYFTHEDDRVLEIGCGSGDLLAKIKGKHKTGIDFSEKQIQWAKEKYAHTGIEFIVMDANNIQLNEKYDLIIISNLIGFTEDIQKVFEQLHKVCHERTKIIVQYYNSFWEPFIKLAELLRIKRKTPVQNWLTSSDVNNLLYISGFEVYRNSRQTLFPFYIPFISAFLNKLVAKLPLIRYFNINHFSFARPFPCKNNSKNYTVSVIIPARNEAGNIENAILRLPPMGKHTEIIFVEGNSTDNTWEVIQQVQQKYHATHDIKIFRQPGKGKADAVREGFKHAACDILMILDADLTVPPEDLPKFYNAIAQNKGDFVNGTRLVYPMEKQAMRFLNYLGNHFFSWTFSFLLEQRFKDTLCGTKVLFKSDYEKLIKNRSYFGDFDPFGDFDLLFGAHKLNLKMVEIPIRYRERTYGNTNISRFKHGWILLKMCLFASRKCKFI